MKLTAANGTSIFPARFPLEATIIFLLALATRVTQLDRQPTFDEIYHLLAATSWAQNGHLSILDGVYERTSLFTMAIGWLFWVYGEASLTLARLPSVLFGCLLPTLVFLWTRASCNRTAAWIAGLLTVFWHTGIEYSQILRFYAPHGLLFFIGAIAAFHLTNARLSLTEKLMSAIAAALSFAAASYLQITTFIGLLGIGFWFFLMYAISGLRGPKWRYWAIAGAVSILFAAGFVYARPDFVTKILHTFFYAPQWAMYARDNVFFYHAKLREFYPVLWPLFPVAGIIALTRFTKPVGYCICVFGVGIFVHSLAGMKDLRYVYYLMPFFFIISGAGISIIGQRLIKFVRDATVQALDAVRLPTSRTFVNAAIAVVLLFAFVSNPFFKASVELVALAPPRQAETPWGGAKKFLKKWNTRNAFVMTGDDARTAYYVGDFDVTLNRARLEEIALDNRQAYADFQIDVRFGRPVIGSVQAVRRLAACRDAIVFVTDRERQAQSANLMFELQKMALGPGWETLRDKQGDLELIGWVWRGEPRELDCSALPPSLRRVSAAPK